MRTMHPVLKRGGLFWDRDLLPPAAYAQRLARVQAQIAEAGDDAWLIYGDVERYGSLAYVGNFLPRTRCGLALVPAKGEPSMLISVGARDVPAAKTLTSIEDVRPFTRLPRELVKLIEEKALANARIGLVSVAEFIAVTDWEEITAGLPGVSWTARTAALAALRDVKDSFELRAIRQSASAVEDALGAVPDFLCAGMSVRQVTAEVDRLLRRSAAEDVRILVAAGDACGVSLRTADDRVLADGDTLMLYAAVEIQRYWAEGARTYVLGQTPAALSALNEVATETLSALRAACVPGASVAELYRLADERLAPHGLAMSASAYGYGHGIGLDPEEDPVIGPAGRGILADGATLALRVICHKDGRGIACGQTVLVRDGGGESLVRAPSLVTSLVTCKLHRELAK
jgi:Xaa-Pro aminopeptidase